MIALVIPRRVYYLTPISLSLAQLNSVITCIRAAAHVVEREVKIDALTLQKCLDKINDDMEKYHSIFTKQATTTRYVAKAYASNVATLKRKERTTPNGAMHQRDPIWDTSLNQAAWTKVLPTKIAKMFGHVAGSPRDIVADSTDIVYDAIASSPSEWAEQSTRVVPHAVSQRLKQKYRKQFRQTLYVCAGVYLCVTRDERPEVFRQLVHDVYTKGDVIPSFLKDKDYLLGDENAYLEDFLYALIETDELHNIPVEFAADIQAAKVEDAKSTSTLLKQALINAIPGASKMGRGWGSAIQRGIRAMSNPDRQTVTDPDATPEASDSDRGDFNTDSDTDPDTDTDDLGLSKPRLRYRSARPRRKLQYRRSTKKQKHKNRRTQKRGRRTK